MRCGFSMAQIGEFSFIIASLGLSLGVWEFFTRSDDGSVLLIDGRKVVDNDSSHAAVTATGRVALEAGLHACELLYFEDYEGQELEWGWKAPGEAAFSPIPAENLFVK